DGGRRDRRRQSLASVLACYAAAAATVSSGRPAAAHDFRVPRLRQHLCDDRRRPGQFHYGVVDVHLPDVVRAIRLRAGCCVLLVDVADGVAGVPVLYRRDPPARGDLMAQVVGSKRKRQLEAVLVYAVLAVLVLAFVFPLIWVLGLSLKTRLQIFATPPLYLWWPTLENYADVVTRRSEE